jgi:hypothetical protein
MLQRPEQQLCPGLERVQSEPTASPWCGPTHSIRISKYETPPANSPVMIFLVHKHAIALKFVSNV